MISTAYTYSGPAGFLYDASKIGFSGNKAKLLLLTNPGQTFAPNISAATYDPTAFQYVGGSLRQKDQRPANLKAYFAWDSQLAGNYCVGGGSLTVGAFNGAAIAGGVLDLRGHATKYVTMPPEQFPVNQGTIAFEFTPNYNGHSTFGAQQFFIYGESASNNHSLTGLNQQSDNTLYLQVYSGSGAPTVDAVLPAFVAVLGQTYKFVLQIDTINGATKLFIDGVQWGSTQTGVCSRNAAAFANSGVDAGGGGNADFTIANLAIYNAVVSPTNATPLADSAYLGGTVVFPTFTYPGTGDVTSWTSLAVTDTNSPGYILNGLYYNGSAWVASNGSFAQTSTAAVLAANIGTLPLSDSLIVNAVFQNSNTSQASIASLVLTYVDQTYDTTGPTIAPNIALTLDQLTVFVAVASASGSDGVHFFIMIGAIKYWWNGSAWAVSDGSYAQSNIATDVQAHASTLPVSVGVFLTPFAILHSATGRTTPDLTSLALTYDYFGFEPAGPNYCTVFGYVIDDSGVPIQGAVVSVSNPVTFINQGIIQAQGTVSATTNALGYFTLTLAETTTVKMPLNWNVVYPTGGGRPPISTANFFGKAVVPNAPSANLAALAFS